MTTERGCIGLVWVNDAKGRFSGVTPFRMQFFEDA